MKIIISFIVVSGIAAVSFYSWDYYDEKEHRICRKQAFRSVEIYLISADWKLDMKSPENNDNNLPTKDQKHLEDTVISLSNTDDPVGQKASEAYRKCMSRTGIVKS
ncbi:MAG: hypothetical protein COA86_15505 [Kangiella sp.]|nr:MAG: hypothetical protein COA86_15505 [Kangiella sp.]